MTLVRDKTTAQTLGGAKIWFGVVRHAGRQYSGIITDGNGPYLIKRTPPYKIAPSL